MSPQLCNTTASEIACVQCSRRTLEINLNDGRNLFAPLLAFPGLANATQAQLDNWILADGGRVLGWPELGKRLSLEDIFDAAQAVD